MECGHIDLSDYVVRYGYVVNQRTGRIVNRWLAPSRGVWLAFVEGPRDHWAATSTRPNWLMSSAEIHYRRAYDEPGLLEEWTWDDSAAVLDAILTGSVASS
jgi:hypothetical protein